MGPRGRRFESCHPDLNLTTRSVAAATHPDFSFVKTKLWLSILSGVFWAGAIVLDGQVATDSGLQSAQPQTTPPPPAPPQATVPERAQIDEIFKQTSLGKEADQRRLHIEWRQLQNQVVNEPDIVASKRAAETARTDLEKRQRLRDYYDLYYGRMRVQARSAEMKTALDELRIAHLSQITQPRVRHVSDAGLP
ncbi:MAG: hypothetical protein QOE81_1168, partial [Verrucomicrobiota bacterium]